MQGVGTVFGKSCLRIQNIRVAAVHFDGPSPLHLQKHHLHVVI